jgi:hypothetical protein
MPIPLPHFIRSILSLPDAGTAANAIVALALTIPNELSPEGSGRKR